MPHPPEVRASWRHLVVLFAALSLLLANPARAAQSELSLRFSANKPSAATALHLHIVYRKPSDPNGKPSPIRHLVTEMPPGTRVNLGMPRCTASDQQIMASGPAACPANSKVGEGTLIAITGFGPPFDPYPTDVTVFNTGQGMVEVIQDQRTGATLADDRLEIRGNKMIGNPPPVPGGPPDGQTAVRTIDQTFPLSSHYFTTPPTCPGMEWRSRASFTFADGTTQHVSSSTPCVRPATHRPPRIRVRGMPRRCVRRSFGADVRIRDSGALKVVRVRIDGRVVRATRRKRFTVRIGVEGLGAGRHRLTVTARDRAGKSGRFRRSFTVCPRPAGDSERSDD